MRAGSQGSPALHCVGAGGYWYVPVRDSSTFSSEMEDVILMHVSRPRRGHGAAHLASRRRGSDSAHGALNTSRNSVAAAGRMLQYR